MFIRAKYVLQFSRRDDPGVYPKTLFYPAIEAAGSKAEESLSYNYRFHIVTRCNS